MASRASTIDHERLTEAMLRRAWERLRETRPQPYRRTDTRECRAARVRERAMEARAALRESHQSGRCGCRPCRGRARPAPEAGMWVASPLSRFAPGMEVWLRGAEHVHAKRARALRAAAMDVNRVIFGPDHRLGKCLRDPRPARRAGAQGELFPRHVEGQAMVRDGEVEGLTAVSGLVLCSRPWVCPECRLAVLLHHGADIAIAAIRAEVEHGWTSMFLTLTFPTVPGSPLEYEWGLLSRAWRSLVTGKFWPAWCQRWGIEEWVATTEVNWRLVRGQVKWHPHDHLLLHSAQQLTIDEVDGAAWELMTAWRAIIQRLDPTRVVDMARGVTGELADRAEDLGRYLTKFGIGYEMADAGVKVGRADEAIPAPSLTAALAATGPAWSLLERARHDWRLKAMVRSVVEFEQASKRKDTIRHSKGWRTRLLPDSPAMATSKVRSRARTLRIKDAARLQAALGLDEMEEDKAMADAEMTTLLAVENGTWMELEGFWWNPSRKPAVPLPALEALRHIPWRAAFCELLETYGALQTAVMLSAALPSGPRIWRTERGAIVLGRESYGDDWVELFVDGDPEGSTSQ